MAAQVFLNDWAAAVPLHEAHHFYGALFFAADAVLTAHDTKLVGLPRHDLEMIVKVTSCVCVCVCVCACVIHSHIANRR